MDADRVLKLLEQIPSAVAIIFTVSLFIKHMTGESKAQREFFKDIHAEHIDQRVLTRQAMERMVAITEQNISATNRNTFTLEALGKSIDHVLNGKS